MEPLCTCPRCGDQRPLTEVLLTAIDDQAFLAAVQAAANLPPALADSVIRYMRMYGGIRPATYAKLLGDLVAAINSGRFVFRRQEYPASPALWLSALTDAVGSTTVRLPLKAANGHNFLYAIAADKAHRATAAAEQRREEQLRHAPADRRVAPPSAPTDPQDQRRRELEADVRHWQNQVALRPTDQAIVDILEAARTRLQTEFPPAETSNES